MRARDRFKYWSRWVTMHGISRAALLTQVRKMPLADFLLGPDRAENHYRYIEAIRARGPIAPTRATGLVFTGLELTREILRDNRYVTAAPNNLPSPVLPPRLSRWIYAKTEPGLPNPVEPPAMLAVDPPEHTRFRKLVSKAFTPRAVSKLEDRVREVTVELLDGLEQGASADLLEDYASQLPVAIIAEMLGVPRTDAPFLLQWGNHGATLLDVGMPWTAYRDATQALTEIDSYFDAHLIRLRKELAQDPTIDGILASIVRDGGLDDRELKATMALLLGAGFETTVNLIGNGIVALLRHPEQLAFLRENPDGWPNAIEEILRYDSPVQLTARVATQTIQFPGHTLEAGAMAVLLLGGANRDPAVFDQPDVFDVCRTNAREHVAFGSGIHVCLGASLARMEGVVALQSLFERFPDLALAADPTPGEHVNLHGFGSLPVNLGRARVRASS
ncbi:cytochrome P450 [Mycobacterium sp. CBMA271]|uniref:cytochrome P450 n=1 Tax=unclassified Mycobacteroides TaxID=2618759 RepID=UPI0012DCBDB4|nr:MULTISPECIES: cytochrome P450 [unclassified Mycobacteroides]MUM19070.1 cytochrome [Mycobacteroides sp. CBMA 326]MUM21483.1 cytochrome P450 [Mycobacteroides sp. CBMA 271]